MGALRPGQMLDGTSYQVVREIGAGGMGVVYEIEHVRLKKRYVAKVIHDQIKNDDGAAKRMEREAQVLAAISHPNVVQVHDVGTTQEGVSYFVMEKLEGVDLRTTMRQGVTRLRSIEIVTDVLDALEYVHRRGIVHRDIKPENIFLSEQPRGTVTKVLDFGIVHIFDKDGRVSQGRITKTGGFVGTLYYAAPEQMQGKAASPPNDVYAAGLVLFEILAGKGPFDDDPGVGLSRCFKPAPLLTDVVPQAPRELSDAVAKALEQDPERRPSAGALAVELRAVAAVLKSNPRVAEDEAIRAEVHDLLRHMPLADDARPRPAAGRLPTPSDAVIAAPGPAVPGTAAPATPIMAGAPARVGSEPRGSFEATLASAKGEPGLDARAAVAEPLVVAPPPPHTATMLGAGVSPRDDSAEAGSAAPESPGAAPPIGSHSTAAAAAATGPAQFAPPQRISSPSVPPPVQNAHAHAMSAAPPSPRFPPATDRGLGPSDTNAIAPGAPGFPSQPAQPPLFAATMPIRPMHQDSSPGAPARTGDTSPGLYATVDHPSTVAPLPKQPPWTALTLAAGGLLLVALLGGGALVLRQKPSSSSSATSPVPAPDTSAVASSASEAPGEATATPPSQPASPPPLPPPLATPPAESARVEAAPPPASPRAAEPKPAPPHVAATPPPRAPSSPTTTPTLKPTAAPRATSTGRAAEKDGYVNTF